MKTTKEIKAALKTLRERAAAAGQTFTVTRSRRGVEPLVVMDCKVYSIDDAIAAIEAAP